MYNKRPLVSVKVLTYNSEDTVRRCLYSVLSQKTDFVYEVIVCDDCSTDNTKKILLEIQDEIAQHTNPPIFRLYFQPKNKGILGNYKDAISLCNGKYIAGCDGDDYWCDENKIQKQVDIMEADSSVGLVYTDSRVEYALLGYTKNREAPDPSNDVFSQLLRGNFICTPTVMYRKDLFAFVDFDYFIRINSCAEDLPIWLELAAHSKFVRLPDITVNYYINKTCHSDARSAFVQSMDFDAKIVEIKKYYVKKYRRLSMVTVSDIEDAFNRRGFRFGIYLEDKEMAVSFLNNIHCKSRVEKMFKCFFKIPFVFNAYMIYRKIKFTQSNEKMLSLIYS